MASKIHVERGPSGIYKIRFTSPSGRRVQVSSRTRDRRQAEELGAKMYAEAWRVEQLGDRPRRSWAEAVARWLDERPAKRSLKKDTANLRWLHPQFGGLMLEEITADRIRDAASARAAERSDKREKGDPLKLTSPATVNRMLALIRSILRAAVAWEWLDRAPVISMRVEKSERMRWLTRDEADRLIAALPDHLKAPARFTLATGLREQNVLRLEWSQVDLDRRVAWVHADQAKGGASFAVPLNADAVVCLRGQIGVHDQWCFIGPKDGPVVRANNHGWRSAIKTADVAPLRWHDLRHTWASWHMQAGTPAEVLMKLGGWKTLAMVMRYSHLSPGHLAAYADAIAGPKLVRSKSANGGEAS